MASLPPYETLVRWTVVDTTRWLAENGLGDFKDAFRKEGVDGSKLAKLNDTDIDNLRCGSTKKRIQLKNAISNIDRSRINSLPRTQGIMSTFQTKQIPSEPAPPPRPPRAKQPLPSDHRPPSNFAPAPPSHEEYDHDDNEDAYSWGDDFYESDGDEDYVNDSEWPHDHNSNNIGFNRQSAYEDADDEEYYEQPTNSPSQSYTGGGIVEKLQKELTRRSTLKGSRPSHQPVASGSGDEDDEDYETPLADPPAPDVPPARPPRPAQRSKPPAPVEAIQERPPPHPVPHTRAPPPIPAAAEDDEQVYDEPDADIEKTEQAKRKEEKKRFRSRELPPVPTPGHDDRAPLPTPPRSGKRPPIPKPPVQEPEETYEPMDAPQSTMPSRVPDPVKSPKSKPHPTERSSRPLPHAPKDTPKKKGRNVAVPPPVQTDELDRYDWYHKNIDRTTAESSLLDQKEDGMYLIRKSKRGGTEQQYTLTIYKQGRVYNLPIRKRERDGKFALGAAKPNELDFDTVTNLVEYFKTKLIMLNPKAKNASGSTRLMVPMPK